MLSIYPESAVYLNGTHRTKNQLIHAWKIVDDKEGGEEKSSR